MAIATLIIAVVALVISLLAFLLGLVSMSAIGKLAAALGMDWRPDRKREGQDTSE